jgi:hypothetical protein
MKFLLTTMLVFAVAVLPALAGAQDTKGGSQSPSQSTSPSSESGATGSGSSTPAPSKPDGSPPSASPSTESAPASKDDCMKGGWAKFANPKFKSESECVSSVDKQQKGK